MSNKFSIIVDIYEHDLPVIPVDIYGLGLTFYLPYWYMDQFHFYVQILGFGREYLLFEHDGITDHLVQPYFFRMFFYNSIRNFDQSLFFLDPGLLDLVVLGRHKGIIQNILAFFKLVFTT